MKSKCVRVKVWIQRRYLRSITITQTRDDVGSGVKMESRYFIPLLRIEPTDLKMNVPNVEGKRGAR